VWDTLYSKANLLLPGPPSWGSASFANCSLHLTLQQLRQRERAGLPPLHRTGGLGRMMQPSIFEVNLLVSGMSEVCVCVCVCTWLSRGSTGMGVCGSAWVQQQQSSYGWLVLLGTKTSEDQPFWLLSSYVNVLLKIDSGGMRRWLMKGSLCRRSVLSISTFRGGTMGNSNCSGWVRERDTFVHCIIAPPSLRESASGRISSWVWRGVLKLRSELLVKQDYRIDKYWGTSCWQSCCWETITTPRDELFDKMTPLEGITDAQIIISDPRVRVLRTHKLRKIIG
jgi:hypothetical protein